METNLRKSREQDSEGVGLAASIINFMKQGCFCTNTTKKREKRQLHQEEKKHPLSNNSGAQVVTLEEWILASPYNLSVGNEGDNQFQFSKQLASKRVHPSYDRTLQEGCLLSKSRENFNMERSSSVKFDRVERRDAQDSSLCKSQSGKLKKKVSFKIPEVADVFILHSPE
ncbi:hypothetical protein ACH5RR_027839 [Cinchona calisaya]|uniref:Uncharacterized protein n=1 Tax=Cinchona calisaya TaxID=153742 RepID=A0ABD2YM37_9GENT